MPELAEVDYFRRRWDPGLGATMIAVEVRAGSRVFREAAGASLVEALPGRRLESSQAHGKQMVFRLGPQGWLGLHLGMTGDLRTEAPDHRPERHDHLVLHLPLLSLVFRDPRQFGAVRWHPGAGEPEWWAGRPPQPFEPAFTAARFAEILARHPALPLKALLLRQEDFPGVGNWMADEILWRARLRPSARPAQLGPTLRRTLYRTIGEVCRDALATIGPDFADPPDSWLFNHRWRDGGRCPRTGQPLRREPVGGRTTCWSPAWQVFPRGKST